MARPLLHSPAMSSAISQSHIESSKLYREAVPIPLCAACGEKSSLVCGRCALPLCVEHMHGEEERCKVCEAEYDALWTVRHFSGAFGHKHKKAILIGGLLSLAFAALSFGLVATTEDSVLEGGFMLLVGGACLMDSIIRRLVVPRQRRRFVGEALSRSNAAKSGAPGKLVADVLRGENCSECNAPSAGSCSRCAVLFCRDHRMYVCLKCETACLEHWSTSGDRRRAIRLALLSLGAGLPILAFVILAPDMGLSLIPAGEKVLSFMGVGLLIIAAELPAILKRRARKAFMRERESSN